MILLLVVGDEGARAVWDQRVEPEFAVGHVADDAGLAHEGLRLLGTQV